MITFKKEELLKETPEYEPYDKNEVNLTIEELRKYGIIKCGGCCSKKSGESTCCRNKKNKQTNNGIK
ncbi:MAG: hypothetical protein IJO26_04525 [Clostridium sp.]|nr:hypothetical protein [Clostridium sp.]